MTATPFVTADGSRRPVNFDKLYGQLGRGLEDRFLVDLGVTPVLGTPVAIADGLWWLRARLPLALDHVNLWLCDDGDGWTIIDTGYGDTATQAMWQGVLGSALAGRPVHRVLVTHFHPDHAGQAGWLCRETGAGLWMSRTEWLA